MSLIFISTLAAIIAVSLWQVYEKHQKAKRSELVRILTDLTKALDIESVFNTSRR